MTENIAMLLGQIQAATVRLQSMLPYADPVLRKMAEDTLNSQREILGPKQLRLLTLDEESTDLTPEQKAQLKKWRADWIPVFQQHLEILRMASNNIWQQFQMKQQSQQQFLQFLHNSHQQDMEFWQQMRDVNMKIYEGWMKVL